MKKLLYLLSMVLLVGCATNNPLIGISDDAGRIAGFWQGLLQGAISPITLIISLFKNSINIYEVHNTGFGYNAGFLLGIISIAGSGCSASRKC